MHTLVALTLVYKIMIHIPHQFMMLQSLDITVCAVNPKETSTSLTHLLRLSTSFSCSAFFALLRQVTMADRSAADRACKDPNPIIDGRKANVNLAYLGAKPRVMQPGKHSQMGTNTIQKYIYFSFLNKPQKCVGFLSKLTV